MMETTGLGKTRLSYARDRIDGVPITCLLLDEAVEATQRSLDLKVRSIDTSVGNKTTNSDSARATQSMDAENA